MTRFGFYFYCHAIGCVQMPIEILLNETRLWILVLLLLLPHSVLSVCPQSQISYHSPSQFYIFIYSCIFIFSLSLLCIRASNWCCPQYFFPQIFPYIVPSFSIYLYLFLKQCFLMPSQCFSFMLCGLFLCRFVSQCYYCYYIAALRTCQRYYCHYLSTLLLLLSSNVTINLLYFLQLNETHEKDFFPTISKKETR